MTSTVIIWPGRPKNVLIELRVSSLQEVFEHGESRSPAELGPGHLTKIARMH